LELSRDFTVFTYDRRGRGESGDTAPYALEREVAHIQTLVDEAGGSAHLYGISSGAVLALEAAARGVAAERPAVYEPPFIVVDRRPPFRRQEPDLRQTHMVKPKALAPVLVDFCARAENSAAERPAASRADLRP
jgi:alpha-beta hydrolase superfamily lysophospholipase